MFNSAMLMSGKPFHYLSVLHFDRMSDTSDPSLLQDIDNLIRGLLVDNLWDAIDDLCVVHNNSGDSLLGLKGTVDAALWGSTGFSTALGFTCDKVSNYCVNSGLGQGALSQFQNDDMHYWAWRSGIDAAEVNSIVMGAYDEEDTGDSGLDDIAVIADSSSFSFYADPGNTGTSALIPGTGRTVLGFIGATRRAATGANNVETRANAANAIYSINSTHGAPSVALSVGARYGRYPGQDGVEGVLANDSFAGWGTGSGLTSTQLANLRSRIDSYMTARGL